MSADLDHLDRQDEGEGQLNGGKMARWRDGREGGRHEACPPRLDEGEGEKIDPEEDAGEAPLRENLAAGVLALSGWTPEQALHDPMCGSGTSVRERTDRKSVV